jgi:mannose-6-phosphate isomerase
MENKKAMYPLVFIEEKVENTWGKDSWIVADTGAQESVVQGGWLDNNSLADLMEAYTERVVGEKVMSWYGRQFPVSVKISQIQGRTPLWVHPDDEIAAQRYDALGKAKLWYVSHAGENARLCLGFKKEYNASDLYLGCQDGKIADMLHKITPQKGEAYLIEPGMVHAAQDVKLIEIQEASTLDFCIYNWGREDESQPLMLEEALDFIDYGRSLVQASQSHANILDGAPEHLAERDEFIINKLCVSDPMHIYTEEFESFILYVCAEGEVSIQSHLEGNAKTENLILQSGKAVLIPADMKDFFLVPRQRESILLEVRISREEINTYTGESVEEDEAAQLPS